jgi:hypothetical protein
MTDPQAATTGGDPPPAGQRTPPSPEQMSAKVRAAAERLARAEEQVAATFERIAQSRPNAADRLMAEAANARLYAAQLRDQVTAERVNPVPGEQAGM